MDAQRGSVTGHRPGPGIESDARAERYRRAERDYLGRHRVTATERFVEVGALGVRLRVLEVGSGPVVVFVHGTGGSGAYFAPVVACLSGFRSLLLDRPGWGLSTPLDYRRHDYRTVVVQLLEAVLDAFDVDRAHVVGGSIGDLWALTLGSRRPERVDRVVMLGAGPVSRTAAEQIPLPPFLRLLRSPVGALMVRVPPRPAMDEKALRGLGHGASLDAGRLDAFIAWRAVMSRETDWMRHERTMVQAITDRRGMRPDVLPPEDELRSLRQPTLLVYGDQDPGGTVDIWRRFVATLPTGELQVLPGGGHLPWLDHSDRVGGWTRDFLSVR